MEQGASVEFAQHAHHQRRWDEKRIRISSAKTPNDTAVLLPVRRQWAGPHDPAANNSDDDTAHIPRRDAQLARCCTVTQFGSMCGPTIIVLEEC